jgi:DNA-binding NtrC family response regulator
MTPNAKRILVAEDDPEMRLLLRKALSREGYEVETVGDGLEAVNTLRERADFHLLVTDIRMPHKDGIEVLREVRELRPGLRVIMVTGYGELDQYLSVMRQGAFEYLTKPFKIPDLLQVVDRALADA